MQAPQLCPDDGLLTELRLLAESVTLCPEHRQTSMESGDTSAGRRACRVQGRLSASLGAAPRASSSLLACPTSAVSALSPCPASASLTGLAQARPSAPLIPACPCRFADRVDAEPVPRDLVPAFCSALTPCSQLPGLLAVSAPSIYPHCSLFCNILTPDVCCANSFPPSSLC